MRRVSGPLGRESRAFRDRVPASDVVYTDDTGWRVRDENAQLSQFALVLAWFELLRTRLARSARGQGAGVAGGRPMEIDPCDDPLPPGAVARIGTTRLRHPP